jgi:histidyl-tRNA synthetase
LSESAIEKLQPVIGLSGDTDSKLKNLEELLSASENGMKGIAELKTLFSYLKNESTLCRMELDLTLARGLNYYTGAIIEVKSADVAIGSICGGGRYDDLTGIFGLEGVSGVGVSFGADRIYDVMEQLGLSKQIAGSATDVLILNFGEAELQYALGILNILRKKGIRAELYPDQVKLKKQMSYADARKIPYIIIAGEEEIRSDEVTVKNMSTGDQKKVKKESLPEYLSSEIT